MVRPTTADALTGCIAAPRADLCLDFVDTRYWRGSPSPIEQLHGIGDVLAWSAAAGGVDPGIVADLGASWLAQPREADTAFAAAIALRETLHRMFGAVAEASEVAPADLALFNAALAGAAPRTRMARRDGFYFWDTALNGRSAASLLSPVLWSAADLLAGARRDRVRQCANPRCRWLFFDDSKGGNRRWCSMAACGNRAKAHRHYLRRKQG
jgi:predicted RNA-binding Zn ribbon-like protein